MMKMKGHAALEGQSACVRCLLELDGGLLASGSHDWNVKVWTVSTGECLVTMEGHEGEVFSLTVLGDGRLASGSHDATIKLWELTTSACVTTLEGHESRVTSLALLRYRRPQKKNRCSKTWTRRRTGWISSPVQPSALLPPQSRDALARSSRHLRPAERATDRSGRRASPRIDRFVEIGRRLDAGGG